MKEFVSQFRALGHRVKIVTSVETISQAERLFLLIEKEFLRIQIKFSKNENSIVSTINLNAGCSAVEIDEEVSALLDFADVCYNKSNGELNCLDGSLKELWDKDPQVIPSELEICQALENSSFRNLNWSSDSAYISQTGSILDLSPLLIGYALERAKELCQKEKAIYTLIQIGQQYLAIGAKYEECTWNIPLKHPRSGNSILFNLPIEQGSVGHTGDFTNYNYRQEKRICDVLSPITGHPNKQFQSCWIYGDSPLLTTTLSRIVFSKGLSAIDLLEEYKCKYILVENNQDNLLGKISSNILEQPESSKFIKKEGKIIPLFPNPSSHHSF